LLHWTGDGLHNRNGEEQGRQRKAVGSEGRKDREVTASGKSSLQLDVLQSMHNSAGEKVGFELQGTSNSGEKPTLDAKQLLATVPKTKKELFSHDVNWAIYDEVKQTYPPFPFYFST
jgi:RNA-binding protein 25